MIEFFIIGVMVCILGVYFLGWWYFGVYCDFVMDVGILWCIVWEGEDVGLDYLFFGDWLVMGFDLEFCDLYLLVCIDFVSVVLFFVGVILWIGLIVMVNMIYVDFYVVVCLLVLFDVLMGGWVGVNFVIGVELCVVGNYGWDVYVDNELCYDWVEEFVEVLWWLWDLWSEDVWIVDVECGVLIDLEGFCLVVVEGVYFWVVGLLNVVCLL